MFTTIVFHSFCPSLFICANIISIPKDSKVNLSDSDKYRSIAISSLLGIILDDIIIVKQSDQLLSINIVYANSSTVLCSTMVNEAVQYYTENMVPNECTSCFLMLLKHSTKLLSMCYSMNFEICSVSSYYQVTVYFMYSNQSCSVKWDKTCTFMCEPL